MNDYLISLAGGIIIGIAVSFMLYLNGRVTGISGIVYKATVSRTRKDLTWRWVFIFGLFLGGLVLTAINSDFFRNYPQQSLWNIGVAGLLVGFGTALGSGCTSGHGVCGISRLSPRALLATVLFILSGVASVSLFKMLGALP